MSPALGVRPVVAARALRQLSATASRAVDASAAHPKNATAARFAGYASAARPAGDAVSATPLPVGPISADTPRRGPGRSWGLPVALALVLIAGVAGGVGRALARVGGRPRR